MPEEPPDEEFGFAEGEGEQALARHTSEITVAEKVHFLRMIYAGYNRQEAARSLGYHARSWRAICSPRSPYYDEEFANDYAEAASSPESQSNFLERLRAETMRRAMLDSDRLLEKLNMVHDPEWAVLRQKDVNVNVRAVISQYFNTLSAAQLDQLLAWMDERSDHEILEGVAREITPAVVDAA